MGTSIGGLSSGLDTTSLINSLMQVESQPQTALKTKVSTYTTSNSAYQTVNAKMKALLTAAQDLTKADTWKSAKATSSSTDVVATASTGAQTGDLTFSVTKLASSHRVTAAFDAADTPATTTNSFDLTIGVGDEAVTTTLPLDWDQNTPQGVADAINQAGLNVRASVVTTDAGPVLQMAATKPGAANEFTIVGLTSAAAVMTPASDGQLTVGDPADGGFTVTSSSNTFAGVMPGVTITASKLAAAVTVSVASDADALATKMAAMVEATNAALSQISVSASAGKGASSSGATSNAGPLAGDYTVRQLSSKMLSAVSTGFSGFGSFKQLGIQLTSDGKLTFAKDDFLTAYQANPTTIQDAITNGVAKSLESVSEAATDTISGSVTQKIQSGNTAISRLNKEILDWDTRLADRKTALQRQFSAMESALSKISSQSSWLSSQTAGSSSNSS